MANDGAPANAPANAARMRAQLEAQTTNVAMTNGVATLIDSVLVKSYANAVWEVTLIKAGARRVCIMQAVNDGTSGADATLADYTEYGAEDTGTVDVVLSCDVTGTGASQVMRLLGLASSTGWTAYSARILHKAVAP